MNSIKSQLWPMADETVVVPGHGPTTTIGYERRYNTMVR
jgi:glyoxylase-like metal-dependent hydrolase (beta-lactamase superfamily II)